MGCCCRKRAKPDDLLLDDSLTESSTKTRLSRILVV